MRALTCLALASAFVLAPAPRAQPEGDSATWNPTWTAGDYWIVRSPLYRHVPIMGTSEVREVRAGFYFTRFLVRSDERSPASRRVTLEIKYRENDAFTFDDMLDSAELDVDMSSMRVVRARMLGPSGDGTPIDWETKLSSDVAVFQWKYGFHGVPPTLPVLVPIFTPADAAGEFTLAAATRTSAIGPGLDITQDVTVTPQGVLVRFWTGEGAMTKAPIAKVEEELLFRPGKPWPDVQEADGTAIATVVEVGRLP